MADNPELFCCSICLGLLKDPVTTACGHSYCMGCINDYWDQGCQNKVYSCPQCRQTFTSRPTLKKNTVLAEVVGNITDVPDSSPSGCYAEPGDVECDVCTGRKQKAFKSCLVCLASYCETHLQPHFQVTPLKKHKLVKALARLEEKICSHHDKLLEVFCRTDQQCICYQCVMGEHKGHDIVSVSEERSRKLQQLKRNQDKEQLRTRRREKKIHELRKALDSIKDYSWATVDDFERTCLIHALAYIRSIERRRAELKEQVRACEKAGASQAEGLLKQLEKEAAVSKRREAELDHLSNTEDHIHFLQSFNSLWDRPEATAFPNSFKEVTKLVSEQMKRIEDIYKDSTTKILDSLEKDILTAPPSTSMSEFRTRSQFLIYSCYPKMELNPDTACWTLTLSDGNKAMDDRQ
ncbi:hypothetical protein DPEC_G00221780 [Dallia pectoralis]|uniref:Uncharacterized protein n=1 Tax=Dallia pectoralis TaxID=75939 RepID=A0ACC2G471_DALPE|nr:hypothetical protein DPEC_G00221780 [Dallia pectoralis]